MRGFFSALVLAALAVLPCASPLHAQDPQRKRPETRGYRQRESPVDQILPATTSFSRSTKASRCWSLSGPPGASPAATNSPRSWRFPRSITRKVCEVLGINLDSNADINLVRHFPGAISP